MSTIAMVTPKGVVGKTTVTLGRELEKLGRPTAPYKYATLLPA